MASISANGSKGHHKFTLNVTETSTNIGANTSAVSWSFVLSPIVKGYDWNNSSTVPVSYTVTINGTKYTGNIMKYDGTSTVTVNSGSLTIAHDTNGSKTISFSFSVTSLDKSYLPGSASSSGTMALTNIPRQATLVTAPNFSDGENPTITYSNPAGNSVDAVEACIISADDRIVCAAYRSVQRTETSYTFPLTDTERETLRNAAQNSNSLTVEFNLRTTIGGVYYWSEPIKRTFSITNANPIITASVVDVNSETTALTGNSSKLIKYYSSAQATMSAEAQKGAAINNDLYIIRNGNNTGYGKTYTFYNVESNQFTFSAEDSRGNVGTKSLTPTMVNYIKLTCNIADNKPDALGNMNVACSGNYFNGNFGATDNELTVQYRYKKYSDTSFGSWHDMSVTKNGNSYYASADFDIPNFSQQTFYSFETRAIDKLMTVPSKTSTVKSTPIFHWGENDFVFEVPVTFNAGVVGVASTENTESDTYNGIWTPSLNSSAISSYTTQYGWYSKIGQSVTVGFYIKATCKSGYSSTAISISGLPFAPMYSAAGGGMCSGAYFAANQNFQCFVAETSKSITVRTQMCNNTTATNLITSASGCWYPISGGEITLSGTITFIANS